MPAVARPRDREILLLALPALGALVAEPLYVLGDTAIIGHLGTVPLAGLALAGLLLAEILGFCTFLAYGTTSRAARLVGAGRTREALDVGVQATWLAAALGVALLVAIELAAGPAMRLMAGGDTAPSREAVAWIRIAALGAPFVLMTAAAQGWLRAFRDTTTPLVVIGVANVVSIGVSLALVRGAGMGIEGSAVANVLAQAGSAAFLTAALVRRGAPLAPSWARIRAQFGAARDLTLRTAAFFVAFTAAAAVAARMGTPHVAAHQIGFQLWIFCALFLDATAIAAQALIGNLLGAGAVDAAASLARRLAAMGTLLGVAFALILAAGHDAIPRLFTGDDEVLRQVAVLWPWFVAMLPLNGLLFALDGVLFGAGDLRFMRNVTIVAALAGYLPLTVAAWHLELGLGGIWAGLSAFIWIRLAIGAARWWRGAWLVGGVRMADESRAG